MGSLSRTRSGVRALLVLAALLLLAGVLAGAALATELIGGRSTILTDPCGRPSCTNNIRGHVVSPVHACERGRVVLIREVDGPYGSRDRTDRDGRWRTEEVPKGDDRTRVFAIVRRKELSGDRVCVRIVTQDVAWIPATTVP